MSEFFRPEVGHALFGQPWQSYECPGYVDALLAGISHELERVMWNRHQRQYDSPFGNNGGSFKNDTFEVTAYSWEDDQQPFNFAWRDVRISWYKYLGRDTSSNVALTPELATELFADCMASLDAFNQETIRRDQPWAVRNPEAPIDQP